MSPVTQRPEWRQTTANGEWVYVAAYPKDDVAILTMDDYYARLTPDEARGLIRNLEEAVALLEKRNMQ